MRKYILMMLLVGASSNANADWILVTSNEGEGVSSFANPSTIRKMGKKAIMWSLNDFTSEQRDVSSTYLSEKKQVEYDCAKEKSRMLTFVWYSKNMGQGKVIYSDSNPYVWESVVPDSIGEAMFRIACGMK